MHHRSTHLVVLFLLLAVPPSAQLEYGGAPLPQVGARRAGLVSVRLPAPNVAALLLEDEARPKNAAWRFGETLPVELGIRTHGLWERLPGGDRVWRLRIESQGAYSLSLMFSRFVLPEGAELFVYDDQRTTLRGAYLHLNNKLNGEFAIQPIAGDALTLEYFLPARVSDVGELQISGVVYDYRDVLNHLDHTAARGAGCNNDVACMEGLPWTDQIDATVQIVIQSLLCSGVLLNNTNEDGRQLLLTARHCGKLDNAIFAFNYQHSSCRGGDAIRNQTVQGAVELARKAGFDDFRLVEITPTIPPAYNPYFAGWSHVSAPPASSVAVHHPSGCPKKISFDLDPAVEDLGQWQVIDWDDGTTEPGSSGGPLFDENGRCRGQLSSGAAACNNDESDFFGSLTTYWSLVADYLDPLGAGTLELDGYDPDLVGPASITAVTPSTIEALVPGTEQTITITGGTFSNSSVVTVDGNPIFTGFSIVDRNTITLDMPELTTLGPHTIDVVNPQGTDSFTINVVAPATPKFQIFTGEDGVPVCPLIGLPVLLAGEPGETHFLLGSLSNSPSVLPGIVSLGLGNQFADFFNCGAYVIGPSGLVFDLINVRRSGLGGLALYMQTVAVGASLPLVESNLQHAEVQ